MKTESLFTCPKCGSHKLNEILVGVIQTTEVTAVEQADDGLACDYGDSTHDGGEIAHYECGNCGNIVATSEEQLAQLLFGNK
jgi:predicted RNA-binding Zn-ribbon protein involved in translation (DUF1610 family)